MLLCCLLQAILKGERGSYTQLAAIAAGGAALVGVALAVLVGVSRSKRGRT
jgi:hypothetical protein